MTLLAELPLRCFQGIVPATIGTCDRAGVPNITYLSQIVRIDDKHVALSCQFFNKTKQNVLENPYAVVQMYDPVTFDAYRVELRYVRSETEGPLFDAMALRIQAIASHTGMSGVFRLLSADVYELLSCEREEGFLLPCEPDAVASQAATETTGAPFPSELAALQRLSQRSTRAQNLEDLLTGVLETLDEALGFAHAMILLPDESGTRLFAIASRGYADAPVGAEINIGEGLIGTVARERRPLQVSGVEVELRYGRAIRAAVAQTQARRELRPEIPLPGLHDAQSQMALPLCVGERLLGVLAIESRQPFGLDEWGETFLEIVANQIAVALENALLRERREEAAAAPPVRPAKAPASDEKPLHFRFFPNDDCVFVEDEYLIRNVPGRILWKILSAYRDSGRTEFSNRELRLDPWLRLPQLRDNLESRLVLLRKRLEQRCPDVRLVSTARGHFRLETDRTLVLREEDEGPTA